MSLKNSTLPVEGAIDCGLFEENSLERQAERRQLDWRCMA